MRSLRRARAGASLLVATSVTLGLAGCSSASDDAGTGGAGGSAVVVDPFCATRPKLTFCEDFDTAPLPGAFAEQVVEGTATLTLEETAASPAFGLRVVAGGSDAAPATGVVKHTFDPGERLRLFAQVYVPEGTGQAGEVEVGAFERSPSGYRIGFVLLADGTFAAVERRSATEVVRTPAQGALPRGVWVSMRWDVNLYADGSGTALLRFGNDTILQIDTLAPPVSTTDRPTAVLGLARATGAWEARFDNVTVEIED